jgi:hypothetical protein
MRLQQNWVTADHSDLHGGLSISSLPTVRKAISASFFRQWSSIDKTVAHFEQIGNNLTLETECSIIQLWIVRVASAADQSLH